MERALYIFLYSMRHIFPDSRRTGSRCTILQKRVPLLTGALRPRQRRGAARVGGCGEWKTAEVVRGRVTRLDSPRLASRPDTTRLDSTRIEKPRQRQREREREREKRSERATLVYRGNEDQEKRVERTEKSRRGRSCGRESEPQPRGKQEGKEEKEERPPSNGKQETETERKREEGRVGRLHAQLIF